MGDPFVATHQLSLKVGGRWLRYAVMVRDDGAAYTRGQYEAMALPVFARLGRQWFYKGRPFPGRVRRIR